MYKFIYYYYFKLSERRFADPRFQGGILTGLAVLIHLAFIFSIAKLLFDIPPLVFSKRYYFNKLLLMPFALLWLYLFNLFFKKQHKFIEKFYNNKKILTIKNGMVAFSLLLIPLILSIILSIKGVP